MAFTQRLQPDFYRDLQASMREHMREEGLDLLLVDHHQDVAYATGFSHYPNERPVVFAITAEAAFLLVPELERDYAAAQRAAAEVVNYFEFPGIDRPFQVLARAVGLKGGHAGFGPSMEVRRLAQVRAAMPQFQWRESQIIDVMRLRKRPEEILLHREASRISDAMVAAGRELVIEALRSGHELPTEAELASHVVRHGISTMYAEHENIFLLPSLAGALVYTAENSAFPHGMPSSTHLKPGDTFMLSLGCAVGGRYAESERTFIIGEPTAKQRHYYETVFEAQRLGTDALMPGTPCGVANRLCLDVIRDAGYGDYILHRQGHGIGLGNHEPPWVEDGDDTVIAPGMILSSEPGIYVPGHAGYRISDTVLITDHGPERLTTTPRDLASAVVA
jgi:Xaa-Pro aminopeptidase